MVHTKDGLEGKEILYTYKVTLNFIYLFLFFSFQTLFSKEADRLEQATATEATCKYYYYYYYCYCCCCCCCCCCCFIDYLFEDEPLVNKFVSVPKEQSSFNCAAFMAGTVEAFLCGVQFVSLMGGDWDKTGVV